MTEQNCSAKVVSIHGERCSAGCPNSDVCYHTRKILKDENLIYIIPRNYKRQLLKLGYKIHESLCDTEPDYMLLSLWSNYNITLPYNLFKLYEEKLKNFNKQIQVSVYTMAQVHDIPYIQKLFLIKNDETLEYTLKYNMWNNYFIHFCFDQNILTREKIQLIWKLYTSLPTCTTVTLDSCLTSWLVNGACPYKDDYVDLTFDGTFRQCPFDINGLKLSDTYIPLDLQSGMFDSLFKLKKKPEKCVYSEIFGGE